jgi:hypothetical protein
MDQVDPTHLHFTIERLRESLTELSHVRALQADAGHAETSANHPL